MSKIKWSLKTYKISDLTDYYKNPRQLTEKQFNQLKKSIDKFGMIDKPVVNADAKNTIIGGHQRLNVLRSGESESVECWVPDHELDEKEVEELNIRLNKNTGEWDFDVLSNEFEMGDLLEWGFEETELGGMELETDDESEIATDDILIGIKRQRWSFKHDKGFLSVRAFNTERKKREMEWLKLVKREQPPEIIDLISSEISEALSQTIGAFPDFVVTSAPAHKTGFAKLIAQEVAKKLSLDYCEIFFTEINPDAKRNIFGDRPPITAGEIKNNLIWIDDTLTLGRTLESCRSLVSDFAFIPIVWVYDVAQEQE